jgi:hypothetical protein
VKRLSCYNARFLTVRRVGCPSIGATKGILPSDQSTLPSLAPSVPDALCPAGARTPLPRAFQCRRAPSLRGDSEHLTALPEWALCEMRRGGLSPQTLPPTNVLLRGGVRQVQRRVLGTNALGLARGSRWVDAPASPLGSFWKKSRRTHRFQATPGERPQLWSFGARTSASSRAISARVLIVLRIAIHGRCRHWDGLPAAGTGPILSPALNRRHSPPGEEQSLLQTNSSMCVPIAARLHPVPDPNSHATGMSGCVGGSWVRSRDDMPPTGRRPRHAPTLPRDPAGGAAFPAGRRCRARACNNGGGY